MTPLGQLALTVVVGVAVGGVGTLVLNQRSNPRASEKTLKWEMLEGEEGSDLNRVQTPEGWLVENSDGYLVVVKDPEHEWLKDE